MKFTKIAHDYMPTDPVYISNLALAYEQLDMESEKRAALKKLSKIPDLSENQQNLLLNNDFKYQPEAIE